MNVVVFGATGGVGSHLVEQALDAGHHVTAAARRPNAISRQHTRLTVVQCDVFREKEVEAAMFGQDAVLCALGAQKRSDANLYSRGIRHIVRSMEWNGVARLVHLSNFGVLNEKPDDALTKALILLASKVLRRTLDDHKTALEYLALHGYQWTAVRPMALTNGRARGRYRISTDSIPARGWRIARADVAQFMLRELTQNHHLNGCPCISY